MQPTSLALCAAIALAFAPKFVNAQSVPDPETFATTAASSNMFEIQSSELAVKQPVSDDVKAFANRMIEDHTAAGEKMKAAAEEEGITPPDSMMEKQQSELDKLELTDPELFEQAYVTEQVSAHDEAVDLFKTYSEQGQDGALKDFAAETLPTLEDHKAQVHDLQSN